MEGFNNENLSDFFDLITSQKKESNKKTPNSAEDTSLNDLFASVSEEKKKEKKKRKEIIGDVSLDDLFSSLSEEKKRLKETEIEKKQEIEQLEKEAKAFESFLYSESTKEEEEKLEEKPPKPKKSKKKNSKKDVIVNKIEEKEEIQEKVDQNLQKSLDILDKLKRNDTDIENEEDPALRKLKLEVEQLRKLVESSIRTATAQGGGGEVRLEFLDDVDRDTALVDGKFLKYQSSTKTFVGADASGGDSEEASKLVLDARNNNVGYAITIGTPVYQTTFNSGQDRINIEEARASDSSTMPAKGVTITDLENNTNGQILVYGELEGVDTSAFNVADELYVAPGGGLTNTRPTDPSHLVQKIAVVLKKSASNGAILVYGAGRTNDVPNTISIGGSITASEFYGDGSNLTGITVGAGGTWDVDSVGINTVKNVGIGTTAKDGYKLYVEGDTRVTGILTVGRSSVTIDGENDTVSVGLVTITNSQVILGDNVTINASATGINSAPNVLYVAKDGNDDNNGTSIDNAFLTIKTAVGAAQSGTTVKVLSGNYVEDNPIELPAFSAVVGDDLRTCKILPNNATSDIFHVNKGCKLQNMTFSGHLSPAAAVAFPDSGATNVGGGKWKGPYVQNCTSDTTTGTGIRIDGSKAVKTKSMNVDAFTQYNQGGVGVAVTNEGYAQLVSVFTICCDKAITCHAGGQADVANSNCSFGTLGLVADGKGDLQYIGTCTASADAAQDNVTINVGAETTRPYDGQIVFFGELFESVETITVGSGGTGYTSTPTVTVDAPTGASGETATAFATLEGESVASITIISSGSQYQTTPTVTISAPDVGVNTATATATMAPIYYTINSSTPIVSGITTLTLEENLINAVGVGTSVHFFQQSKIVASSHTFEYIGAGNTITEATPKRGGVTIQANEVTKTNGGNVVYTSTDQSGNFRIGDDLQINQNTGTISGRAFSKSLFSEMTPFILALS